MSLTLFVKITDRGLKIEYGPTVNWVPLSTKYTVPKNRIPSICWLKLT